jgi:hypothetical protein
MAIDNAGSQKIGATALSGYWRQGLAELRAAAPLADSTIAQPTNYAMPGMATPGEVTEARRDEPLAIEEETALVGPAKGNEIGRDGRDRDDPGMDL